jgi:hypothetical protein
MHFTCHIQVNDDMEFSYYKFFKSLKGLSLQLNFPYD